MTLRSKRLLLWALSFVGLACSDNNGGPSATSALPASLLIVSGQDQSFVVGRELPNALEVKVTDSLSHPVAGQVVNFRVVSGGGSVFAGTAIANDSGLAKERWTLGTSIADSQRLEARAVDPKTGAALVFGVFRAIAVADVPAALTRVAGDSQKAVAAHAELDSLAIKVADQYGNPVSNAATTWSVTGGGSVSPNTSTTGANGIARTKWTVGTRVDSAQRVTALDGALAPVVFTGTVLNAPAASLSVSQAAAGAPAGSPFTQQPIILLSDAFGNRAASDSSTVVTMTVSAGAAVVGTATATAIAGVVTFTSVGVSGIAGTAYTLTFGKAGLTSATQSITPTPGSPSQLVLAVSAAGAASGAAFTTQPVVAVRDAGGNTRVSDNGTVVTMTVGAGATTVGTATATAVAGIATFTTVGVTGTAGTSYTLMFSTGGLTATTQSITPTPGAASQLVLTTSAAGAASGVAFTTQPAVAVRDAGGNTLTSVNTTAVAMAVSTGATVVGTTIATATGGVATFATVGLSGTAGTSYTLTFSATGLTAATQSITPTAGPVANVTVSPSSVSIVPMQTLQAAAVQTDASGNTTSAPVTWNSLNTGVATVSASGLVTGVTLGTATLTATTNAGTGIALQSTAATIAVLSPFTALTTEGFHTCALTGAGAAFCWGVNDHGQLGDGTTTDRITPVAVQGGIVFTSLTAAPQHTCGLTSSGTAYCWGANNLGALGDGTTADRATPVAVQGGLAFASLTAGDENANGGDYTCGLTNAGAAYCWGNNAFGELGDSTQGNSRLTPTMVSGGLVLTALSAGGFEHTCGLTTGGAAYCWGNDGQGQLGNGTSGTNSSTPVAVQGGLAFTALTSRQHTCGLTSAGVAYCWGLGNTGQIGDGATFNRLFPTAVQGGLSFTVLAAGEQHTCGLTSAGAAYCWGPNTFGTLGDSTTNMHLTPVAVHQGAITFTALTAGQYFTCGLANPGVAYCWGYNGNGQLGDGTTTNRLTPVAVIRP